MLGRAELCCTTFLFKLCFESVVTQMEIIAIAHAKRRPGYWRERLKE